MQKKLLGYDQITRVFDPAYEQISLGKFFEDPLNIYLLSEGTQVRVVDRSGRMIKAYARSYDDGIILSCRLPSSNFQFGQKVLVFIEVGIKSYAIQTIIKSAHMGDLYVEDTSTRFFPRFKTAIRAAACQIPGHYVSNLMEGKWFIERVSLKGKEGQIKISDVILDWKTTNSISNIRADWQINGVITSISQGGFALSRNIIPGDKPLKYVTLSCGYYHKNTFIQLELIAVARQSFVEAGVETTNYAFISPLPSLTEDIFPHEKKLSLTLDEKVEIYFNGEIRGYTDKLNLFVPPGVHHLRFVTFDGRSFEETIVVDSFNTDLSRPLEYYILNTTPARCKITEAEHDLLTGSGI